MALSFYGQYSFSFFFIAIAHLPHGFYGVGIAQLFPQALHFANDAVLVVHVRLGSYHFVELFKCKNLFLVA